MPATTYIVIDHTEKRTVRGRHEYLGGFLSALAENPTDINEFSRVYEERARHPFFTDGNRPRVPEKLSPSDIRRVLGMEERDMDEVLEYWRRVSLHRNPNYQSAKPDQKTDYDIPESCAAELENRRQRKINLILTAQPLTIEVGYGLVQFADRSQGGDLIDRITTLRQNVADDLGLELPPIRIRDNMQLAPNWYRLKANEVEVANGCVEPDKLLAMDAGLVGDSKVEGIETTEPAFGYPSIWIDNTLRDSAEASGYIVVTPSAVIATHLGRVARDHVDKIWANEDYRNSLIVDIIVEADLRTKTLRYATVIDKPLELDETVLRALIPEWTIVQK